VTPRELADSINTAVEAREAKLRGPLRELMDALDQTAFANWRMGKTRLALAWQTAFEALKGAGPEYVPDDVANALAFEYGRALARLEGPMMVLLDPLLWNQMGLGPMVDPATLATADQLLAEVHRRGLTPPIVAAGMRGAEKSERASGNHLTADRLRAMAVQLEDHTRSSLPNLPSELRPDQVFGPDPRDYGRGQHQWRDAAGEWHDFEGGPVPQGAVQLRVLFRSGANPAD
jgi:hypothetical protein